MQRERMKWAFRKSRGERSETCKTMIVVARGGIDGGDVRVEF
jgi:hypothetical protein